MNGMVNMVKQANRRIALALLGVIGFSSFSGLMMPAAQASHKKWRNYALGGAAVTGYGLLKHKKGVAVVGALGTAYAYSRYRKGKKSHNRYGSYRSSGRRYNSYARR